jgi:hypothetical protein
MRCARCRAELVALADQVEDEEYALCAECFDGIEAALKAGLRVAGVDPPREYRVKGKRVRWHPVAVRHPLQGE